MKNKAKGFTLVELMITIFIVSILAAIAIPSFQSLILNGRLSSFSNDMLNSLALAKNEAVSKRTFVNITPKEGDWINGWIVDSDGTEIAEFNAIQGLNSSGDIPALITITPKGFLLGLEATGFKVCDKRKKCREITISASGIATVEKS